MFGSLLQAYLDTGAGTLDQHDEERNGYGYGTLRFWDDLRLHGAAGVLFPIGKLASQSPQDPGNPEIECSTSLKDLVVALRSLQRDIRVGGWIELTCFSER